MLQIYNYFLLLLNFIDVTTNSNNLFVIYFSNTVFGFIFLPDRLLYSGLSVDVNQSYILLTSNILLIVIPFLNIFLYRNRKMQFILNRLLSLIALGVIINQCIGLFSTDRYEINQILISFTYILTVIFLYLANKSIKRDEDLVNSANRLR